MKQSSWFIVMGGLLLLLLTSSLALAAPHEHLNWGSQINHSQCPNGNLVVNVTQKILNDADSGTCGNAWAFDDIVRQIQVVQTGTNSFCATVKYEGHFTTVEGPSPGGFPGCAPTAPEDGVKGTFECGYISPIFTATPKSSSTARTRGNIGTFDYNCDQTFNCLGYVDWSTLYFDGVAGFDLAWWGWVYHAGNNGSWVNAITGNSGDITGNQPRQKQAAGFCSHCNNCAFWRRRRLVFADQKNVTSERQGAPALALFVDVVVLAGVSI